MSQKVVVVEELGVLPALPQTEQAEVKVHLDHLLPYSIGTKENIRFTC